MHHSWRRSIATATLFMAVGVGTVDAACKYHYTIVTMDKLNNVTQGWKDTKWLNKMGKKYSNLCYTDQMTPGILEFYILQLPANSPFYDVRHDGNNSAYVVPVNYDNLMLSIEITDKADNITILHNFLANNLQMTWFYKCTKNCHPYQHLIEEAMKWVQKGNLNDPKQMVVDSK